MAFEQMDLLLFIHHKERLKANHCFGRKPRRLWEDSQLLWAGDHYLLVRQGPAERNRETVLLSREALLLGRGNPDKNPMVALALAAIHPVHKHHHLRLQTLHSSQVNGFAHELFKGLRWSKSLVNSLVHFACIQDEKFFETEKDQAAKYDEGHAFSKRCIDYVEAALKAKIYGVKEKDGYRRPANVNYRTGSTSDNSPVPFCKQVAFWPMSSTRQVRVDTKLFHLFEDEFIIWCDAMSEIQRLREKRKQAAT